MPPGCWKILTSKDVRNGPSPWKHLPFSTRLECDILYCWFLSCSYPNSPILCLLYVPAENRMMIHALNRSLQLSTRPSYPVSVGMWVWMGIADASQVFEDLHLIFLVFGVGAHGAHQGRHPAIVAIHPAEHHDLRKDAGPGSGISDLQCI